MTPITPAGMMTIPWTAPLLTHPRAPLPLSMARLTAVPLTLVVRLRAKWAPLPKETEQAMSLLPRHLLPYVGYRVLYIEFLFLSSLRSLLYMRGVKGVSVMMSGTRTLPPVYRSDESLRM